MVKDHLGNEYRSIKEMCIFYNLNVQTYYYRIKSGYSLEEALTWNQEKTREIAKTKFINNPNPVDEADRTDHKGRVFASKTAMCRYYKISRSLYTYRRNKLNMTVEEALLTPIVQKKLEEKKRTINGVVYKNVKSICKEIFADEISEDVLRHYLFDYDTDIAIKKAWSVIRKRKIHALEQKLLKKYGLEADNFNARVSRGMSRISAIITPKREELLAELRTFDGVTYDTIEQMCEHYNMVLSVYLKRRSRGVSKEIALLTPVKSAKSFGEIEVDRILTELLDNNFIDYYEAEKKYPDCKDKNELPFDFYVMKNNKEGLIEFDGTQHFAIYPFITEERAKNKGYKDVEEMARAEFEERRKHDLMKNHYCERKQISLLRIKYNQTVNMRKMIEDFLNGLGNYNSRFNPYRTNEEYYK